MGEFWQAKSKTSYLWHNFTIRRYLNLLRYVRNWPVYLAWKLGGYRAGQIEIELRTGIRFEVTRQSRTEFKLIFMREDYTWPLPAIGAGERATIVDLGANIGFFTLFAASHYPQCAILSVEPFPNNAAKLTANVEQNRLTNCRILRYAVSSSRGTAVFGTSNTQSNPTDARIAPTATADGSRFVQCETISLDELLASYVTGEVALLKMDIEGAEYDALYAASDATLARIRRISLESEDIDNGRRNTGSLNSFLRSKGFQTVEVTPNMLHAWRA